jgi:hypothetical protein
VTPAAKAKAKAKAKQPEKAATPDWLRKAMVPKPVSKWRQAAAQTPQPKRGRKRMTTSNKPPADVLDDPDFQIPDPKAKAGANAAVEGADAEAAAEAARAKRAENAERGIMSPIVDPGNKNQGLEDLITDVLGGGGDARMNAKRIIFRLGDEGVTLPKVDWPFEPSAPPKKDDRADVREKDLKLAKGKQP